MLKSIALNNEWDGKCHAGFDVRHNKNGNYEELCMTKSVSMFYVMEKYNILYIIYLSYF
jgi:hypothetical protein